MNKQMTGIATRTFWVMIAAMALHGPSAAETAGAIDTLTVTAEFCDLTWTMGTNTDFTVRWTGDLASPWPSTQLVVLARDHWRDNAPLPMQRYYRMGKCARLFADDFEDGNMDGWVWKGKYTISVTSTTGADGTTNSLRLRGGVSNTRDGVSRTLNSLRPTNFVFYVRAAIASFQGYFEACESGDSDAFYFYMDTLNHMNLATWQQTYSVPCALNTWYKNTLVLDWTQKRIDWYVNDVLQHAAVPFHTASINSLNTLYIFNYWNGDVYFDEFRLSQ